MIYKKLAVIVLAAAVIMQAAGCGSAADDAKETADSAAAEEAADEEAESEQTDAAAEAAEENVPADGVVDEEATYETIEDFVELGDYRALNIERKEDVVTDSYPAEIGELVGYRLTFPEADYGLTVTMDYVGTIDGVAFEGGTAQNADLKIGSHSFIDDFEDQLVGAKPGDVVEVNVTFPENYHAEDLAGKDALFTCTIHSIWEDMWDGFVDQCEVNKYPRDLYELMVKTVQATNESNAAKYGMTAEEYKAAARLPEESEQALVETKWALVNRALLKELGITPESEAYQAMQHVILESSGYEDVDAALAAGLSNDQLTITTEYYTAVQALLREHGLI